MRLIVLLVLDQNQDGVHLRFSFKQTYSFSAEQNVYSLRLSAVLPHDEWFVKI